MIPKPKFTFRPPSGESYPRGRVRPRYGIIMVVLLAGVFVLSLWQLNETAYTENIVFQPGPTESIGPILSPTSITPATDTPRPTAIPTTPSSLLCPPPNPNPRATDSDCDGVPNSQDTCPNAPGPAPSGCPVSVTSAPATRLPDGDQDDVPDAQDRCPTVAGPDTVDGCLYLRSGGYTVAMTPTDVMGDAAKRLDIFTIVSGQLRHITWENYRVAQTTLSGSWVGEPVAVASAGRIEVIAIDRSSHLYTNVWQNSTWSGWQEVPDGIANSTPAILVRDNRLDVFVVGTDGDIWHTWRVGDRWQSWHSMQLTSMGAPAASPPVAVALDSGQLFVFVRDTNDALLYMTGDDTQWSTWNRVAGGSVTTAPAVIASAPGQLDVFAVGLERTLWHIRWNDTDWSQAWTEFDTMVMSPPAVVLDPNGDPGVFFHAQTAAGSALWYVTWDDRRWAAGTSWDGALMSDPAAFTWPDAVGAVVFGKSNMLWFRFKDDLLQPWESLVPLVP
jgi:hypothetical protein